MTGPCANQRLLCRPSVGVQTHITQMGMKQQVGVLQDCVRGWGGIASGVSAHGGWGDINDFNMALTEGESLSSFRTTVDHVLGGICSRHSGILAVIRVRNLMGKLFSNRAQG